MTDEENDLLEKLRARDPRAMEEIVRLHTEHIYKSCFGLGLTETEAEDLTQSVWMTFFDVVSRFEGRSSLRTFLFGILYNKVSEHRKKNARAEPVANIDEIVDSHFDRSGHWIAECAPVNPDRFIESAQAMTVISKCLDLLPTNQKMAFILKEIEEEITENICHILNVTSSNLGVLLFRARNQLRECVERKSR